MATIYPFRTSNYAQNIYLSETSVTTFETIPAEYVQPVKQFAADKYYIDDIQGAFIRGKITQTEYDETLALKTSEDPQYRPIMLAAEPVAV